jgi:abortive infection bacteriophage resistance protein
MKTIVDARNICCHHNKLFDKKNRMITNVRAIDHMLDRRNNTIYHVCCLMYYLLNQIRPDHQFVTDLEILFSKYPTVHTTFPDNWKDLWEK